MPKFLLLAFTILTFFSIQSSAFACAACGDKETHEESVSSQNENNEAIFSAIKIEATVVLAFHSQSCSTCKVQKPELENILKDSSFSLAKNFFMDFESSRALRKALNVKFPSTVIVFKKGKEVARVTGETNRNKLTSLVQKGF